MNQNPSMAPPISNCELTVKDIPTNLADWTAIMHFAQSFNGYGELGSFEACGDLANRPEKCKSLSDLRACLFFEYRRHNHFGYPPDDKKMPYVRQLIERIRSKVEAGDID